MQAFDDTLFLWLHSEPAHPVLDLAMGWITFSANAGFLIFYIFLTGLISGMVLHFQTRSRPGRARWMPVKNAAGFILWGLVIYALLSGVVQTIKETAARPRPHEIHQVRVMDALKQTTAGKDGESFPSGHTAGAFMVAAFICARFGKTLRVVYGWALLVALSRVYIGAHFPSDVGVGGLLGVLAVWTANRLFPLEGFR